MAKAGASKTDDKSYYILYCCTHCDKKFGSEEALQVHVETCKPADDCSWIKQEPLQEADDTSTATPSDVGTSAVAAVTIVNVTTSTGSEQARISISPNEIKSEPEQSFESALSSVSPKEYRLQLDVSKQMIPQMAIPGQTAELDVVCQPRVLQSEQVQSQLQQASQPNQTFQPNLLQQAKPLQSVAPQPQYYNAAQNLTASEILRQRFQRMQVPPSYENSSSVQKHHRKKKSAVPVTTAVRFIRPKTTPTLTKMCSVPITLSRTDPKLPKIERVYYTSKTVDDPIGQAALAEDKTMSQPVSGVNVVQPFRRLVPNVSKALTVESASNVDGVHSRPQPAPVGSMTLVRPQPTSISGALTVVQPSPNILQTVQPQAQTLIQTPQGFVQAPQTFLQNPPGLLQNPQTLLQTPQNLLQSTPALLPQNLLQQNLLPVQAVQQNLQNSLLLSGQAAPQILPVLNPSQIPVQSSSGATTVLTSQPVSLSMPETTAIKSETITSKPSSEVHMSVAGTKLDTAVTAARKPAMSNSLVTPSSLVASGITQTSTGQLSILLPKLDNSGLVFFPGDIKSGASSFGQNSSQQNSLPMPNALGISAGVANQQQGLSPRGPSVVLLPPMMAQGHILNGIQIQRPNLIHPVNIESAKPQTAVQGDLIKKDAPVSAETPSPKVSAKSKFFHKPTGSNLSSSVSELEPAQQPGTISLQSVVRVGDNTDVSRNELSQTSSSSEPLPINTQRSTNNQDCGGVKVGYLTESKVLDVAKLLLFGKQGKKFRERGPVILDDGRVFVPVAYTGPYKLKRTAQQTFVTVPVGHALQNWSKKEVVEKLDRVIDDAQKTLGINWKQKDPLTQSPESITLPGDVVWIFLDIDGPKILWKMIVDKREKIVVLPVADRLPEEARKQVTEMLVRANIAFPKSKFSFNPDCLPSFPHGKLSSKKSQMLDTEVDSAQKSVNQGNTAPAKKKVIMFKKNQPILPKGDIPVPPCPADFKLSCLNTATGNEPLNASKRPLPHLTPAQHHGPAIPNTAVVKQQPEDHASDCVSQSLSVSHSSRVPKPRSSEEIPKTIPKQRPNIAAAKLDGSLSQQQDGRKSIPQLTVKETTAVVKRALDAFVRVERIQLTEEQQLQVQEMRVARQTSRSGLTQGKGLKRISPDEPEDSGQALNRKTDTEVKRKKGTKRKRREEDEDFEPSDFDDDFFIEKTKRRRKAQAISIVNDDWESEDSEEEHYKANKSSTEMDASSPQERERRGKKWTKVYQQKSRLTVLSDDDSTITGFKSGKEKRQKKKAETGFRKEPEEDSYLSMSSRLTESAIRRSLRIFAKPQPDYHALNNQDYVGEDSDVDMDSVKDTEHVKLKDTEHVKDTEHEAFEQNDNKKKRAGHKAAGSFSLLGTRSLGKHAGFDVYVESAERMDDINEDDRQLLTGDDHNEGDHSAETELQGPMTSDLFMRKHRKDFEQMVMREPKEGENPETSGRFLYLCTICGSFQCRSRDMLISHLKKHYTGELSCKLCKFSAATKQELNEHKALEHTGKPLYRCDVCQTAFFSLAIFKNHKKRHHSSPAIICKICEAEFPNEGGLKEHIERQHAQEYICHMCSQCFVSEEKVRAHYIDCKDGYQCFLCYVKMAEVSELRKHMQEEHTYSGELCLCSIQGCDATFLNPKDLNSHVHLHQKLTAQNVKCCRNKATALVKKMAEDVQVSLRSRMKKGPYTISTDGSNDAQAKQFPLVIRCINEDTGLVTSELLSVPICHGSATGENIYRLIQRELATNHIPWTSCLSLGCDNAPVMTGQHKGVYSFMKEEQPQIFLSGCTLHMVHNAGKKAASHLPPIATALVDIFYYFDKSTERQARFRGTQELYDTDMQKIVKHVSTRWLSIGRCLERLLKNWDPLKDFFSAEKEALKKSSTQSYATSKVEGIFAFVRSPTNQLYTLFLSYTVKVFESFLLTYQAEEPMIHKLRRGLLTLLRTILSRFVKPSAMLYSTADAVDYKQRCNWKHDQDLVIGEDAREFLRNKSANHLRDTRIEEFFINVKKYFVELMDYLLKWLPVNDPVLTHAEVVDVKNQVTGKSESLRFFLQRYPCLLPAGATVDMVTEQFSLYQATDVSSCIEENQRIDLTWKAIGVFEDGSFQELSLVMRGILTIPHSSAHCERIFSCVRKNRTPQRSSLSDSTMESLLVLKSTPHGPVESVKNLSAQSLRELKSAYSRSLKH